MTGWRRCTALSRTPCTPTSRPEHVEASRALPTPTRLDVELVRRGLARSRSHAQQQITAGLVRVNGSLAAKPADRVGPDDELVAVRDGYVSRAAHKLIGALADLNVEVAGRALDAGASTGGFTQVLLQRGCSVVYAVDVGTDQLVPLLQADPRVVVWERTNLRHLELRHVGGEPVDLVVADVSFISLVLLVGRLAAVTRPDGVLLLMVKPQFEVGRTRLGKGGVVRSTTDRAEAVSAVVAAARQHGWYAQRAAPSRLPGPAGNVEYFVLFGTSPAARALDTEALVREGGEQRNVTAATYAVPREARRRAGRGPRTTAILGSARRGDAAHGTT